nr:hypothetical protein [Candidatus Sigynarchaeota archaeon]
MTTKRPPQDVLQLQKLKGEFLDENVTLIKAGIAAIKVLESEGKKEDTVHYLDETASHSEKAVRLLDEIEKLEGSD